MRKNELDKLAIKITRISLSPLYDDNAVFKANQATFMQYRVDLGADRIAEWVLRNYVKKLDSA